MTKTKITTSAKVPQFSIGGDPEIFLTNAAGEIMSSIPVLKHDKYDPIVLDASKEIKLYADNSLAEMAFAPSYNKKDFVETYRQAMQKAQSHLGKGFRLKIQSAHYFKENELEAAFGIDPLQVGCNPEYSHWRKEVNELGAFENTMRSGSSHVHVGHPLLEDHDNKGRALAVIEVFLGCSSILWDNDKSSLERRKKYGKSGSFRPTGYGFETRFMSNYMLNSPKLVELTYDLIEYSLSHIFNNTDEKVMKSVNIEDVQNAINNCDKALAEKVLTQAGLPENLFARVKEQAAKKYSTKDFYSNWKIKI